MSTFDDVVRKKDIALTSLYGAFILALYSIIGGTVYADRADGGWEFAEVLWEVGSVDLTVALVVVAASSLVAYGSDRFSELIQGDVDFTAEDTLAFGAAFGLPVAHELFSTVSDLTAGDPLMQTVFAAVSILGMVYIARTP